MVDNFNAPAFSCDDIDEKPQIEALDTPAIASIYADRLEVQPSKVWQEFLKEGELEPKDLSREIKGIFYLKS